MPDAIPSRWAKLSKERCAAGQWKHFCEISPPGCLCTKIKNLKNGRNQEQARLV